jgi:hypothetical protein
MKKEKNTIDVWHDDEGKWVDYTNEEFKEYFNFVKRPTFGSIREVYLHNSSYNPWMEINFHNSTRAIYNKVHGTYVKI